MPSTHRKSTSRKAAVAPKVLVALRTKIRKAPAFLHTLIPAHLAQYEAGATVFRQGDADDAVFYILSGKVEIKVVSSQGKERVVANLSEGDFIGEGCLIGQPLHLSTAAATEACAISRIPQAKMAGMMRSDIKFGEHFMSFLLTRNTQIEAELVDHLFNSSEKHLARVLLLLSNFGKEGKLEPIPKISQDVLAQRIGTTRSRINYFMNKFRRLGFIEYNGALKIHSGLLNVIVRD